MILVYPKISPEIFMWYLNIMLCYFIDFGRGFRCISTPDLFCLWHQICRIMQCFNQGLSTIILPRARIMQNHALRFEVYNYAIVGLHVPFCPMYKQRYAISFPIETSTFLYQIVSTDEFWPFSNMNVIMAKKGCLKCWHKM